MPEMTYKDLLRRRAIPKDAGRIGSAGRGNIDKTGCIYHVITKSFDGGTVFHQDSGDYRHNLLCRLCEERGITILFSVTMNNHTHDVLLVPDWEQLVAVYRILNLNVSKYLRRKYPRRFKSGMRVLRRFPTYIVVRDIVNLFCLGKYIYDNPAYMREEGKFVPHSCFWMFEREYFSEPYDERLYVSLFGMTAREMLDIYSSLSAEQVRDIAVERFRLWTEERTRAVFYR